MSLHWKQQKSVLSLNAFFENSFHCPHLYTCMYILKIFDASCTNYHIHVQTTSKFNYRLLLLHEKIWNRNTDHLNDMTTCSSSMLANTSQPLLQALLSMKSTHMTRAREIGSVVKSVTKWKTMRKSRGPAAAGGGGG